MLVHVFRSQFGYCSSQFIPDAQFIEVPTDQGVMVGGFLKQRCRYLDGRGYSWSINGTSVDSRHDKVTVMEWGVVLQYGPVVIADDYLQFKCFAFLINGQIIPSPVGSLKALSTYALTYIVVV